MRKLHLLTLCVLFCSSTLYAQKQGKNGTSDVSGSTTTPAKVAEKPAACPKPSEIDFKKFCNLIFSRVVPNPDSPYASQQHSFEFENSLWKMSCAKPDDDEETAIKKVQVMWSKYKQEFTCDVSGFTVTNGGLLKYSVFVSFHDFIRTLVLDYDLDINFVDKSDNKNVLDYVDDKIERMENEGRPESAKILRSLRADLVRLGAKTSK